MSVFSETLSANLFSQLDEETTDELTVFLEKIDQKMDQLVGRVRELEAENRRVRFVLGQSEVRP
jgi:hypothetical protein